MYANMVCSYIRSVFNFFIDNKASPFSATNATYESATNATYEASIKILQVAIKYVIYLFSLLVIS